MSNSAFPILSFVLANYKNFNARATRDALIAYRTHRLPVLRTAYRGFEITGPPPPCAGP